MSVARTLFPLDGEAIRLLVGAEGLSAYRARQIRTWIFRRGVPDFESMTDLPAALRQRFAARFRLRSLDAVDRRCSSDGTVKTLFRLDDGEAVESVLMPLDKRQTLCMSSQVGCAMGCRFCATGASGFRRNLRTREMLEQALDARGRLRAAAPASDLTNVVVMGMGEPFENFDAVQETLRMLVAPGGLGLSKRRITVSTSGHADGIRRLGREGPHVNLAVSLNAPDDALRSRLMPVNRRYPLGELLSACRAYPVGPYRRITFEYVLLAGVNDGDDRARHLAALLRGFQAKVNLIPLNTHVDSPFRRPSGNRVHAFQRILQAAGLEAPLRASRGGDVSAACGQLRAEKDRQKAADRRGWDR